MSVPRRQCHAATEKRCGHWPFADQDRAAAVLPGDAGADLHLLLPGRDAGDLRVGRSTAQDFIEVSGTGVTGRAVLRDRHDRDGRHADSFQALAIAIAVERDDGTLKLLHGTPMPAMAYFIGKVGQVVVTTVIQIGLLLAVAGVAYDVPLPGSAEKWVRLARAGGAGRGGRHRARHRVRRRCRGRGARRANVVTPVVLDPAVHLRRLLPLQPAAVVDARDRVAVPAQVDGPGHAVGVPAAGDGPGRAGRVVAQLASGSSSWPCGWSSACSWPRGRSAGCGSGGLDRCATSPAAQGPPAPALHRLDAPGDAAASWRTGTGSTCRRP